MGRISLVALFLATLISHILAQTPQSFNYQAIARNSGGDLLGNQAVSFRFSLVQGTPPGPSVYVETQSVNTNEFGLATLNVGEGSVVSGSFGTIDWSAGPYYLKVEMDENGGSSYQLMGTMQLLSVPYAMYSERTANPEDADADPFNEIQSLSKVGSTVSLSGGGGFFTDETIDGDADPANEIQFISKEGDLVTLSDGGGSFTDATADADADPGNELNSGLVLSGNTLELTDAGGTLSASLGSLVEDSDWTVAGDDMYSNPAGNVGIGTSTPVAKLDVAGRIAFSSTGYSIFIGGSSGLFDDLSDNRNVFVGQASGLFNVGGENNVAYGGFSLHDNVSGSNNVSIGHNSHYNLKGSSNVAVGADSYYFGQSGINNTAVGYAAMKFSSGDENTVVGSYAGQGTASTINGCVFLGYKAGFSETNDNKLYIENSDSDMPLIYGEFDNDILGVNAKLGVGTMTPSAELEVAGHIAVSNTGNSVFIGMDAGLNDDLSDNGNTYVGDGTGRNNVTGVSNAAVGKGAMGYGDEYSYSTALGYGALLNSITSSGNVAVGYASMMNSTTGSYNNAIGYMSLYSNETGNSNCAMGRRALEYNTTGNLNVAIGSLSLHYNVSGSENTVIGTGAGSGSSNQSISGSVFIGYNAGSNENTDNKLYVENSDSNTPLIYGEFDNDILAVNGKLGIGIHSPSVRLHVTGGSDASLTSGGYLVAGTMTGENVVIDENEIMARLNGAANTLHLQRDGGVLSVHYGLTATSQIRVQSDGKTGIGTTGPNSKLHVNSASAEDGLRVQIAGGTKFKVESNGSTVAGSNMTGATFAFQMANTYIDIEGRGLAYSWNTYSDERLKSNQRTIEYGLDEVMRLEPKSYDHHSSSYSEEGDFVMVTGQSEPTIGFIAQEVRKIIPEAVTEPEDESTTLWSMDYVRLIPVLTKAIQEQQEMIEAMQMKIDALNRKLSQQE